MAASSDDIIRHTIASLRATATDRPVGYEGHVLSKAVRSDATHYWIRRGDFAALMDEFKEFGPAAQAGGGCDGCGD